MQPVRVLITLVLMIVTFFVYTFEGLLIASPFIAATAIFFLLNFTKIGAISANRKIGKFTFKAIKEEGLKRITHGSFHISEESFSNAVDKIKDVLSEQQYVPEFGFDGMFLHYSSEEEANKVLEKIVSRGLKADTIIDRRSWVVKIEFE